MAVIENEQIKCFIESSDKVSEIASVLENLKIYHFTFLERFDNGETIYFSNNKNWIKDYFEKELYKTSQFDKTTPEFENFKYIIWPETSPLEVYKHARDYYDSDHGITLIKKKPNSRRYFFFSTRQNLEIVRQTYINHLDALERFAFFFEQEAAEQIQLATKAIKIPRKKIHSSMLKQQNNASLEKFYESTKLSLPQFIEAPSLGFVRVSPQEWKCFQLISDHYTMPEIAEKLGRSVRTIEAHLNSLKSKFGCFRKTELFELAIKFKYLLK